jgi:hypothetical protein
MKVKPILIMAAAVLSAAVLFMELAGTLQASGSSEKTNEVSSRLEDQEGVSVTVYNSNLGLVKDVRRIRLPLGLTDVQFTEVASQIMPQTVNIKSLDDPDGVKVLEQNYRYDLLTPQKLIEKYVGKEIKVLKDGIEIPIMILSTNQGLIYRMGDRIFTDRDGYPGKMIFPAIPDNLIPNPTLVWRLDNRTQGPQKVEGTYLTQGINWKADYVTILDKEDRAMDLTGWVTLDNRSGTGFRNARLKLVAGDVNRVFDRMGYADGVRALEEVASKPASVGFSEKAFFEYHLYTLERPTSIRNNETKQISLLTANGVPVTKRYYYYGAQQYYRSSYGVPISNQKIGVYVEIANKKDHHLGMPLPKGTVRVYKADGDGSLQFVGEDGIDHTPKDEIVKIKMGEAFDVVAERKQTEWRKLADNLYEVAFEVSVRNHKDSPVTVSVIEPIPGDWDILQTSHEYEKVEAHTVQFDIPVKKDGKAKLRYRVRMRF